MSKGKKESKEKKETAEEKALHLQVAKQMVTLATSGFGLVAALAWNNVIRDFVDMYITKWLPSGSGLLSLFIYAIVVTVIAVIVTTNLTRTVERLEKKQ